MANAEANHELIGDTLYVSEAHVDDGLTIKRWQPRARGRVARIKKRTCHITIKLSPVDGYTPTARPVQAEPEVEEVEEVVEETPATESVGALTPEEQKAAAATKRAPHAKAPAKPEAEKEEKTEEAPKKRAPRVRKKKEEETES